MKVIINLTEENIKTLENAIGTKIKDSEDAEYCLHVLLEECM